jgi:beta-glucosidase
MGTDMTLRAASWILSCLGCLALLAACQRAEPPASAAAPESAATVHPEQWPAAKWPLPRDEALEKRLAELLAAMTVEEKVGQVIQGDITTVTPDDLRKYHLGSVLNGGGSGPHGDDFAPARVWLELADAYYEASVDKSGGRIGIPVIWGIDAVHGNTNIIGATVFPHNVGLGAARDPELITKIAEVTAREIRVTGMEWTFAPVVTVPQDIRWGRAYEGYSEDPQLVASYAGAVITGLQGKPGEADFLRGGHVLANAKHYLGDGGTDQGRDQGDAKVPESVLRDVHGAGYPHAIDAGVQVVMASFSSWNGEKMHGHKGLLTDVLKGRMDFQGFVVGDWNGHGQVAGCTKDNCPHSINAGLDMYMAPDTWRNLYVNLLAQAKAGEVAQSRLDDAVARILRVKLRMGLFEAGPPSKRPLGGKFELLGAAEHRAVARQAVRETLVLLKNEGETLPLDPKQRILVAGDGADNIAKQSGGWTVSWQGTGLDNTFFPGGTSVFKAVQTAVSAAGGSAELAVDGKFKKKPDAAIVVFGENPYAEFQGDLSVLMLRADGDPHLDLMRRLRAQNIPVVAVFLSGRPLWMNRELNVANAFVAAWLPGSEGAGITDVLLGKRDGSAANDFRGRLSFAWPRQATFFGKDGAKAEPLYPLGYGLSYSDKAKWEPLPEDPGDISDIVQSGVLFSRGKVSTPWMLAYTDAAGGIQPISSIPLTVSGSRIHVSRVDHEVQEDSLRLQWQGSGLAGIAWNTTEPVDFARETNGEMLLVMTVRVTQAPTAPVEFSVACGDKCVATLPIGEALTQVPKDSWQRVAVPLKCLAKAGAQMGRLTTGASLRTAGSLDVSISRIALSMDADRKLACET